MTVIMTVKVTMTESDNDTENNNLQFNLQNLICVKGKSVRFGCSVLTIKQKLWFKCGMSVVKCCINISW